MSKVILVVDDSASVRQVVGIALRGAGYTDGQKINLVISDVNMPNMDGITFLKEMKTKANYKFTPVIMLTTEGAEEKKREGQAAGAKAWIVKPFRPEQMLQAVSMLI
jgi:two-component system chemotaxis response regulator CheY